MAGLNETPAGNRVHIAFFGLRNAGKSTLINMLTGQDVAIVSDVAGTTTDPVSKAMEILPLGPCLVTDTAGLDDEGELGGLRVRRTLAVLATADIAVWVDGPVPADGSPFYAKFLEECRARGIVVLRYGRGEDVEGFRRRLAAVRLEDEPHPLVGDLVEEGDLVVCVCPQDGSAPKGRLILPQQQVVRELLDSGAAALVCQPRQLGPLLARTPGVKFVITDSQAFAAVDAVTPPEVPLTSFSIVFARAKGDLAEYCAGAAALETLKDGDRVLVSESCTHHRQCEDIGTVKLPRWIEARTGRKLVFEWSSGNGFPEDLSRYALVVHCGGCMLSRRAVQDRIARCRAAGVPITNYGVCIATCNGIRARPGSCMVERGTTSSEKGKNND